MNVKYSFVCNSNNYDKYKNIKSIKDLESVPLILPVSGTNNRKCLDELLLKCGVEVNNVINIHTSEVIMNAILNDLGVGYLISDLVKDNPKYKILTIKESLPSTDINIAYNRKFLTNAPKRFIKDYINIDIK